MFDSPARCRVSIRSVSIRSAQVVASAQALLGTLPVLPPQLMTM